MSRVPLFFVNHLPGTQFQTSPQYGTTRPVQNKIDDPAVLVD